MLTKKVTLPAKYTNFSDVFLKESAEMLSKRTGINKHVINLKDVKQPSYGPLYSLGPVELETLKTYMKINLANGFIQPSNSLANAPILFIRKPNNSFWLCIDYQGLKNLTIKNRYLILVIGKSLDQLGQAKYFTQLDLTSVYYRIRIKKDDK